MSASFSPSPLQAQAIRDIKEWFENRTNEQPVFRDLGLFQGERYPVAERIARQGLYLPSGLALTEAQLEQVCSAVQGLLN